MAALLKGNTGVPQQMFLDATDAEAADTPTTAGVGRKSVPTGKLKFFRFGREQEHLLATRGAPPAAKWCKTVLPGVRLIQYPSKMMLFRSEGRQPCFIAFGKTCAAGCGS
jgi:hypothetical protein